MGQGRGLGPFLRTFALGIGRPQPAVAASFSPDAGSVASGAEPAVTHRDRLAVVAVHRARVDAADRALVKKASTAGSRFRACR